MLSLDKTKEVGRLKEFLGNQKAVISWKLDGLTIVLTYKNGTLEKAVTRGNGEVGEVITNNAKVFKNLPLHISYPVSYTHLAQRNNCSESSEKVTFCPFFTAKYVRMIFCSSRETLSRSSVRCRT